MNMKFVKGMIIGGLITAGVTMACSERIMPTKKKMVKMGRQFARKMGIMWDYAIRNALLLRGYWAEEVRFALYI